MEVLLSFLVHSLWDIDSIEVWFLLFIPSHMKTRTLGMQYPRVLIGAWAGARSCKGPIKQTLEGIFLLQSIRHTHNRHEVDLPQAPAR